jgi:DNA-binding PadR family transcriptional regulator
MKKGRRSRQDGDGITVASLVILSLLLEKPGSGYDLLKEFESQSVSDWAQVSKAQIYYIIRVLISLGYVASSAPEGVRRRTEYRVTEAGRAVLRAQLREPGWLNSLAPTNFMTWLGLAVDAPEGAFETNLLRRKAFLEEQLQAKNQIEEFVRNYPSPRAKFGSLLLELYRSQLEAELQWIEKVLFGD